jgi:hypothetical protein
MPQGLNNIAVIYHYKGEQTDDAEAKEEFYTQATEYWVRAIRLAPNNYIEAQNWLKTTGRADINVFF